MFAIGVGHFGGAEELHFGEFQVVKKRKERHSQSWHLLLYLKDIEICCQGVHSPMADLAYEKRQDEELHKIRIPSRR